MKIYVLGSKGMLGKYVNTYLSQYFHVVNITRNDINASNINEEELHAKLLHIGLKSDDIVVNCIGAIKPIVDSLGDLNALKVNSIFPRILSNVCEKIGAKMIHPTTDCVFTGNRGMYNENDVHDISDVYGRSKSLGEPNNCMVIRTSIIGEEVGQSRSLIEWIKTSTNKTVNGYTNHYWNGVTCLEFAKICKRIIDNNYFWVGVKHLYSNTLNKKEIVELVSEIYNLNITVNQVETPTSCDRSLSTIYDENLEKFNIPTLRKQIIEMKDFSKNLYN